MKYRELLKQAESQLKKVSDSPFLEALILLSFVKKTTKEKIVSLLNENCSEHEKEKFMSLVKKRTDKNLPLSYITGEKEFYGLNFYVNENVLIPRPETEVLVEEAIKFLKNKEKAYILDVGTGSGNIIVSIAVEFKNKKEFNFFASDIKLKTLKVAVNNAKKKNVKIKFFLSDLLKSIKYKFDLIISNPPYVSKKEYKNLKEDVKNEPQIALISENSGFFHTTSLLKDLDKYLHKNSLALIETNPKFVENKKYLKFKNLCIEPFSDYSGIYRFLKVKLRS